MENIDLSICIPAFNKSKELDQLLASILDQTNDAVEIIICEDFSPERLKIIEIVEKYKIKFGYNKIKLILNETNFGYDKNLRNTIDQSSGKYVMLCGNDDILNPQAITTLMEKIKKYSPAVIVRSYESFNEVEGNDVQVHRYVKNDFVI